MNHTYAEAATELGCSEAWLREQTPRRPLPHIKFGAGNGPVVFTDEHIAQIRVIFEVGAQPSITELRPVRRRSA